MASINSPGRAVHRKWVRELILVVAASGAFSSASADGFGAAEARFWFVDGRVVLKQAADDGADADTAKRRADKVLAEMATRAGVDIVVSEAVCAAPHLNVTEAVVQSLKQGTSREQSAIAAPARPTRVSFVGADLAWAFGNKVNASTAEMARKTTDLLKSLCESEAVDLILHEVAFADPAIDITREVIADLRGRGDLATSLQARKLGFAKAGFVNMDRLAEWGGRSGKFKDAQEFIKSMNTSLPVVAREHGVSVVFQFAVFASQRADITPALAK
jgi:Skp family chaperone for outer membrane proteins